MKKQRTYKRLWVVVLVWRGIPSEVKAFDTETAALKQEQRWRKRMNEQYDETGVFQVKLPGVKSSRWTRASKNPFI